MRFGEQQLHIRFMHDIKNLEVFGASVLGFHLSKLSSLSPIGLLLIPLIILVASHPYYVSLHSAALRGA